MQILPNQPTVKAAADNFIGDAWYDALIRGEEPSRIRVSVVRFAPGARNAWHSHAVGQTVHVTEGVGLIQSRGEKPVEIRPGQTVHTPPGEWHWHGAAPEHFMTHLAMWEASADGNEANWGEQVSDLDYLAAAEEASR
jgi:quercetin dioxygenase-like cupin family protein